MLIVGERINASRPAIAKAIEDKNAEFIKEEAKTQVAAGADYIDVNAGVFVGREAYYLAWLVEIVQDAVDAPLCLDSPDPKVIKAVLPEVARAPMINSITLEPQRLESILPLAVDRGCKLIALCQSTDAMAEDVGSKLEIATKLAEITTSAGFSLKDLYIDPLIFPLSTNTCSAMASLLAIEKIMEMHPGVHTICGLTNISYGLPQRKLINRTFLTLAMGRGLDAAIIDPVDKMLFSSLVAGILVTGKDEFCKRYLGAYRKGLLA